jgi:protein-disulfide isomerase
MQGLREDKLNLLPLLAALGVIWFLVVVLRGDFPSTSTATASPQEVRAIKRTQALLGGVPQHGSVLGYPGAPVTLQFFGDLQCQQSRQVMLGALPFLIRHWVREGKLRIVYRSTRSDTPDPSEFTQQQVAALAAGRQQEMWTFVNLFYRQQGREFSRYVDDAFLAKIAEQAGIDPWNWADDRESSGWPGKLESDEVLGRARSMRSTPSFLIGPTGGKARKLRHFSLEETKVFDEAIRGLL